MATMLTGGRFLLHGVKNTTVKKQKTNFEIAIRINNPK